MKHSPHIKDEPAKPADQFADDAMKGKTMRGHPKDFNVPIQGARSWWEALLGLPFIRMFRQ
ncbi:hypothetical protein [Shimia ponticola]|uniref:hypothetical protein n=1 Tax=Shimia ponticola TaxID=2582893 RepID=UPI0011BF125C|nr:hypothetical protein [Shimia ponticola]